MNIHIIKVSLVGNHLRCTPHRCAIHADKAKTLIVWVLDETLAEGEFLAVGNNIPSPGFQFDKKPPSGRFDPENLDTPKRHVSIMNSYHPGDQSDEWEYTLRVRDADGSIYETITHRGNHPVIINR